MIRTAIIVGSTRPGRNAIGVAAWVQEHASRHDGLDIELIDLADVAFAPPRRARPGRTHPRLPARAHPRVVGHHRALRRVRHRRPRVQPRRPGGAEGRHRLPLRGVARQGRRLGPLRPHRRPCCSRGPTSSRPSRPCATSSWSGAERSSGCVTTGRHSSPERGLRLRGPHRQGLQLAGPSSVSREFCAEEYVCQSLLTASSIEAVPMCVQPTRHGTEAQRLESSRARWVRSVSAAR